MQHFCIQLLRRQLPLESLQSPVARGGKDDDDSLETTTAGGRSGLESAFSSLGDDAWNLEPASPSWRALALTVTC